MKKKLNKKDYMYRNIENKTLIKSPSEINNESFCIKNLKNCKIYLCDNISTIYIINCIDCEIYTGPIETSVFMRKSKNCILKIMVSDYI